MGTKFSSNKDFNRVLAKQPRSSITMPRFYTPHNVEKSNADSLTIPAPRRFSHVKRQKRNRTTTISTQSSIVNESIHPLTQSHQLTPIEPVNISAVVNNQVPQKSENERPQEQTNMHNIFYSNQLNSVTHQQTINGDAVIISRSLVNPNKQQRKRNLSSSRTIVERNGKQYLTELRERTERRYVQVFDESTQKMRLFEVNDYIPYRTVRPYRRTYQYLSQNNGVQNNFPTSFQPNQHLSASQTLNGWSDNHSSGYSSQQNNINVLHTLASQSMRPTTTHRFDHYSQYSQPKFSHSTKMDRKNVSDRYLSKDSSFRPHTPTASDGRSSTSTDESSDSDEGSDSDDQEGFRSTENVNGYYATNPTNFPPYDQNNRYSTLLKQVDPFARSSNTNDHHHYRKRSNAQHYAEPIVTNRTRFQKRTYPDYAPIPNAIIQSTII